MRSSRFRTILLAGCAGVALSPAFALAQTAPQPRATFNIPAQDLGTALTQFGQQSEREIVFSADLTRNRHARAVSGEMTANEALAMLLSDSGLGYRTAPNGSIIVEASDPQSGSAAGDGADQGTVQALIVTAQKRQENIQDVPIAMSAFTQEDLTKSQVAGGPDLMTQVPNFTFTKTNFTGYSIQIRGIGTQAISATTDAAVAVAENNTPFIRNRFFEQEFYDLERVEVLRGPQGTLYGRNATAGVVNIITAKPKDHFEAKLSADVGNYKSTRLEGMINLPLVQDKVALRIAGAWTKRDGYVKNLLTGQQTDGRDLWSTRVTLGLTPTDNIKANLIWEHFSENDDRLRSGKQLCHKDPQKTELAGIPVDPADGLNTVIFNQGCIAASLYSPDSFQTPNGFSLRYYGATATASGGPHINSDPYLSATQSRDLRAIETHIVPQYQASNDTVELQLQFDLPHNLTLASETGFSHDTIFSFEDYNRFDTTPNVFFPGALNTFDGFREAPRDPDPLTGAEYDIIDQNGVFCDPQLGCTNRLAAGDLSTAKSQQFSQEFRLSSNFEGPLNFSLGANFLRYDTEDKYYVFINTVTMMATGSYPTYSNLGPWIPGVSDNSQCFSLPSPDGSTSPLVGYQWSNPNRTYDVAECHYIDPNNIHNLNDEGRNYFLSKNPYHLLSYAAFGEVYYNITDTLKLTGGLRWTIDKKTAPQIPSWLLVGATYGLPVRKVIEQEWREPTGRLALDWKPDLSFTDQTLIYGSITHGYKAGGANPPGPVYAFYGLDLPGNNSNNSPYNSAVVAQSLAHPETFKPEFVNAYELGTKNTLLDGRLTLNLSGFYYDYTGYQISQIVDRSAVNLNFDAKIWGLELESDWRPVENLKLGLKVGYENTRMADGSKAIDLMDRTAGDPNYVLTKPGPSMPSNCIVPIWLATWNNQFHRGLCNAYLIGVDPATGLPYVPNPTVARGDTVGQTQPIDAQWGTDYPGFNPFNAYTHNGEGITKDLSGNSLPNAPHITATITADYTLPLPNDWLVTLHTDLYYQSEAWTRVFNDPGYDKLKAYNNINVAAIFSNEDAGWQVMAYIKNLQNKDNITGAFLNSDDTGLTTNVFLNEPRLYGIRVTKQWSGSEWWSSHAHRSSSAWYPYRLEVDGYYGPFGNKHEQFVTPTMQMFTPDFPFSTKPQNDLDWGTGGGVKFTYQPDPHGWDVSAAVRYGRAIGERVAHTQKQVPGECISAPPGVIPSTKYPCFNAGGLHPNAPGAAIGAGPLYDFTDQTIKNDESHAIADFMIGKDVGLGVMGREVSSNVSAGLSYGHFKSSSSAILHGRPDMYFPENFVVIDSTGVHSYETHLHMFDATFSENREFQGAGPTVAWDGSVNLLGDADKSGRLDLDLGLGGGVLFGKQKMQVKDHVQGDYAHGPFFQPAAYDTHYEASLPSTSRTKSVSVPTLRANLGLTYTLGGVKLSGGYRIERYYKVFDAGIESRKAYDRSFDGVYAKVSIGFGG